METGANHVATADPVAGFERPAVEGDTLSHADQALARSIERTSVGPASVVDDLDLERVTAVVEGHRRRDRARMLQRVRQPLLDDPMCRDLNARRQPRGGPCTYNRTGRPAWRTFAMSESS
jgi:hypothetical protein